jgi:hypothetical protein
VQQQPALSPWIAALAADLEPARLAIANADEPEMPCFLGPEYEAQYPNGVPLPTFICRRPWS